MWHVGSSHTRVRTHSPWEFSITLFINTCLLQMKSEVLPAMQKTQVWSLGWEDPLEKGMATTPEFLPGEFQEPGRSQSMGLQRVGHDWETNIFSDLLVVTQTLNGLISLLQTPPGPPGHISTLRRWGETRDKALSNIDTSDIKVKQKYPKF